MYGAFVGCGNNLWYSKRENRRLVLDILVCFIFDLLYIYGL